MQEPLEIFFSYAREDEALRLELEKHLLILKRQGLITTWSDRQISAGQEWAQEIDRHLSTAHIILLLISPDFLASAYCYGKEMQQALERHERGEAYVIPIILRPADWQATPFGKLQALPSGAKPITSPSWRQGIDEALLDVVIGIRRVIEEFVVVSSSSKVPPFTTPTQPKPQIYKLSQVFVKSGVPHVTFVEHEEFQPLKLALDQPGRGVVIEGPSGVGKTTAIRRAIEDLRGEESGIDPYIRTLSARDPEHRELLQTLPRWHSNIVVVDDFHRLDLPLQQSIVDYLKYLADTEPESKKLVIIGIPQSGQMLVNISFDVTMRIDVFRWGKVKDELILQMIEQGEQALNVEFDRKTEIALAANGSLNIAQYLCFNICYRERVIRTQDQSRVVRCNVNTAVSSVVNELSRKFGESIRRFAAMGGPRDLTSLRLLEELARCENGFLSLPLLAERKRELAHGIEQFISEKWMSKLCKEYPECVNHLFFDQLSHALVVDDPQLTFYLDKMQPTKIAKEAGKVIAYIRRKVFISYSHADVRWVERLRVHLKPLEREGIIDLWVDTKIQAGMRWKEEIQNAIDSSTVAIVLISADFLASDFISEHELPKLLFHAKKGGTTILPLIVAPCLFEGSGVDIFQAVNPPEKPLVEMTASERERTLVKLAETISKRLAVEEA